MMSNKLMYFFYIVHMACIFAYKWFYGFVQYILMIPTPLTNIFIVAKYAKHVIYMFHKKKLDNRWNSIQNTYNYLELNSIIY